MPLQEKTHVCTTLPSGVGGAAKAAGRRPLAPLHFPNPTQGPGLGLQRAPTTRRFGKELQRSASKRQDAGGNGSWVLLSSTRMTVFLPGEHPTVPGTQHVLSAHGRVCTPRRLRPHARPGQGPRRCSSKPDRALTWRGDVTPGEHTVVKVDVCHQSLGSSESCEGREGAHRPVWVGRGGKTHLVV